MFKIVPMLNPDGEYPEPNGSAAFLSRTVSAHHKPLTRLPRLVGNSSHSRHCGPHGVAAAQGEKGMNETHQNRSAIS